MAGGFRGGKGRAKTRDYLVRSFLPPEYLDQIFDELTLASGNLYTGTLVEFWRVVRRKGVWLDETAMRKLVFGVERWDSGLLHSQSRQADIAAFFDALSTWRTNREEDPTARPPHKLKQFFKVTWIQNGIRLRETAEGLVLVLSLGKDGTKPRLPIHIPVPEYLAGFGVPSKVEVGWRKARAGGGYEVRCTYTRALPVPVGNDGRVQKVAAADLGEVHPFVVCDGERTIVYNGGELRSKRRYRNKTQATLQELIAKTNPGSKRRRRLVRSKRKQLGKIDRQIRDIEHKLTRRAVTDMEEAGVTDFVIGNLRRIRQSAPTRAKATPEKPSKGKVFDQKLHQAPLGRDKHYLTYKARRSGIRVPDLVDEHDTTKTCPPCGQKNKPTNRRYKCRWCGFIAHRDAVGSWNIRGKYLGIEPWGKLPLDRSRVVGAVAAPTGVRYRPHMRAGPPKSGVAEAPSGAAPKALTG